MRGIMAADAATLYGPGPAYGQGGGASAPSLDTLAAGNGNGSGMGRPSADKAPMAASMAGNVAEDPTFWLVATLGAAAFLAIYSAG